MNIENDDMTPLDFIEGFFCMGILFLCALFGLVIAGYVYAKFFN